MAVRKTSQRMTKKEFLTKVTHGTLSADQVIGKMKPVTLSVASRDDVTRRARAAFKGKKQGAHISFSSVALLWQTLTKKRWEVLKVMTGQDAMTLREIARRVGRDVKAVHREVHALLNAGVLDRTDDGRIHFPYSAVRVDFTLHKEVA